MPQLTNLMLLSGTRVIWVSTDAREAASRVKLHAGLCSESKMHLQWQDTP